MNAALTPLATSVPPETKRRTAKRSSPTARSMAYMRSLGYVCQVVEHHIPKTFIKRDLFGFIDILCVKDDDIVGVQACSGGRETGGGDVAARVTKITGHENYPLVCKAIRIVVQGWRRDSYGDWVLREVEL